MKKQIKKIVNNQRGSALAFVLIVGMVLMILLGSLMVLANRGIIFTQESVESRQAYADAKSVIEFGKNYINQDINEKFKSDNIYKPGDKDKPQGETSDNIEGDKIFYITGTRDNPSGPLKLSMTKVAPPENDTTVLGVCHFGWKKTVTSGSQGGAAEEEKNYSKSTEYTYKIRTQNMRRKLDFQTVFMYIVKEVENGMSLEPQGKGILIQNNKYVIESDPEDKGDITGSSIIDKSKLNLKIKSCARDTGILGIKAKNISSPSEVYNSESAEGIINIDAEETVYFDGNFTLKGKNDFTEIKGKNIVFNGDLKLEEGAKLRISADRLWVVGAIILDKNSELKIERKGTGENSEIVINERDGIKAENTFAEGSEFSLEGKKAWIYGSITGTKSSIDLLNLDSLITSKIISTNCKINIDAKLLNINGNLEIKVAPGNIKTQIIANTFVCTGDVSFKKDKKETVDPIRITANTGKSLNLWFQGKKYLQETPVTISNGNQVAFGKDYHSTFKIAAENSNLVIDSKEISFYCLIDQKLSMIECTNLLGLVTLNFNREIQVGIIGKDIIRPGQYQGVPDLNKPENIFLKLTRLKDCPSISDTIPFKIPEGAGIDYKPVGVDKDETGNVEEVTTEYFLQEVEKSTS